MISQEAFLFLLIRKVKTDHREYKSILSIIANYLSSLYFFLFLILVWVLVYLAMIILSKNDFVKYWLLPNHFVLGGIAFFLLIDFLVLSQKWGVLRSENWWGGEGWSLQRSLYYYSRERRQYNRQIALIDRIIIELLKEENHKPSYQLSEAEKKILAELLKSSLDSPFGLKDDVWKEIDKHFFNS